MLQLQKSAVLPLLLAALLISTAPAHERETDPRLAELNDYIMALQVMRHSNPAADSLFHRWQELREASWAIRDLTDEQDLAIDDPQVTAQIERTRSIREELLEDCRTFFRGQTDDLPTARIRIGTASPSTEP